MTDSPAAVRGAARLLAAFLAAVLLGSCGSGAVSPRVNDPTTLTVMPNTATLYSGFPTTFVITGGTGQYVVSSSDQATVPVSGLVSGNSLVVIPNNVIVDTSVTLTVRDTGATTPVSATLTVKPNPLANDITITASGTQGGSCAPAICSGGDAVVTATISQGGIPISARGVRMEVVSGDFRFIVSPPDQSEVLATSTDVVTDQTGKARARIRVLADAANQTAIVRVTDLGTLAFRDTSFFLSQSTGGSPGFFVTPDSIEFTGPTQGQCASSGVSAAFFVFGGIPPYTVLNSGGNIFSVDRFNLSQSGDSVTVTPNGICSGGLPITVRDSAGHTAAVTVSNVEGTAAQTPVVASPSTVSLATCAASASVVLSGGTGSYGVVSGSNTVVTSLGGSGLTIKRRVPSAAPGTNSVSVAATDGRTSANITVNLTGEALGACPPTAFTVFTNTVTLNSCGGTTVQLFGGGGVGTYAATSSDPAVSATISGDQVIIARAAGTSAFAPPASVVVTSGSQSQTIPVNAGLGGTGACP